MRKIGALLCIWFLLLSRQAAAQNSPFDLVPLLEQYVDQELGLGLRPGQPVAGPAACTIRKFMQVLSHLYQQEGARAAGDTFERFVALETACAQAPGLAKEFRWDDTLDYWWQMGPWGTRQSPRVLRKLALYLLDHRQVEAAVPLLWRSVGIGEDFFRARPPTTESRMLLALQEIAADENITYSALYNHLDDPQVERLAVTLPLLRKARALDKAAELTRRAYRGLSAEGQKQFDRLRQVRGRIAYLSLRPAGSPGDPGDAELRARQNEADQIEEALGSYAESARSTESAESTAPPPPRPREALDRTARALRQDPDSALVEIVAFDLIKPNATYGVRGLGAGGRRYLAMVLLPDGHYGVADLGPAPPIDTAAQRLLDGLRDPLSSYLPAARELYQLVMAKVLPMLKGHRHLRLSLDGALNLVPFAVLDDGHRPLIDGFQISYLTSARDLWRDVVAPRAVPQTVLVADPDFGGAQGTDAASRGARFWLGQVSPLPGTRQEAEAIHRLIPSARMFLGKAATKTALLHISAPDVLVVSTHGFYLKQAEHGGGGERGFEVAGETSPAAPPLPKNPLLRSALILASAGGPSPAPAEPPAALDGLATALEVAGMDLGGTQLVVLSACETGEGDVYHDEGVYGLRRAVMIAGAETVVTSLWRVDDQVTRTLMESYFANLLKGRGRADAMQRAAQSVRKDHEHPYYWAPFIVLGRSEPLSGYVKQKSPQGQRNRKPS